MSKRAMWLPTRILIKTTLMKLGESMREFLEIFFSIAIPTAVLVGYALILARREDRELSGETEPRKRPRVSTAIGPDPDAHLGRVGTE
jgi:hypothetical protein